LSTTTVSSSQGLCNGGDTDTVEVGGWVVGGVGGVGGVGDCGGGGGGRYTGGHSAVVMGR